MYRRRVFLTALVTTFALLLVACTEAATDDETVEGSREEATETVDESAGEANDDDEATETVDGSVDESDEAELAVGDEAVAEVLEAAGLESPPVEAQELDVSTLEVETAEGTFQAEEYDNTFVDALTDDIYIGVALGGQYAGEAEDVVVYLCDSDAVYAYLTGGLENGEATLQQGETEVELTVAGDEVTGTVALNGEDPQSFSAMEATGDAGMYQVADQIEDEELTMRWIVLPDGTQRGKVCAWIPHSDPPQRVCVPVKQK